MKNMKGLKRSGIDYDLYTGSLSDLPFVQKTVINTINQYSYCIAEKDDKFKQALRESEVLLPDGEGIVFAERFLTGKKIRKISGTDLHLHLLSDLNERNGRCFYLGSSTSTLQKIRQRLYEEYPGIEMGFFSPPFKPNFNDEDNKEMIEAINSFNPDVLFIGLTAPKQEKWANEHKKRINAKIICAVGAVFDFYAGTVKRPGQLWIDLRLEWLGRFIHEPSRMWRRYFYYGPIYLGHIIKKKLNVQNGGGNAL
ncbi:WecB/TagA/CpsF family glycosyltransferase [Pedobacter heparinus]|uniref:WecB/TagA/CpsF family glycosyltransferase n=1 Tax=Pedobacter heparinus TaxID=984 RepID=UPI00292F0EEA|nr:WecB/TagA/CpsF family glycosyltransferase [Pedobacter heparinus]